MSQDPARSRGGVRWTLRVLCERLAWAAIALGPRVALAHTGQPIEPHDLARAWLTEPVAAVSVLALGVCYALGIRRLRARAGGDRGVSRGAVAAFASGWVTLAIALVSPLHALGGALFAAHMAQHELLMTVAAPLLILGRPVVALAWALPTTARRPAAIVARVAHRLRVLADPWVAAAVHGVAIWAWHAPALYAVVLRSEIAHAAQHASFLGTALLFWWAVLGTHGGRVRHTERIGARIAVLFLTALHTGALGALFTFAPTPLISAYLTTTAPWGLTPLEDQQLAGLIMWIPGGIAYLAAVLALMARVLRADAPAGQSPNNASTAATSASPSYGFSRNAVSASPGSRSNATSSVYPDM